LGADDVTGIRVVQELSHVAAGIADSRIMEFPIFMFIVNLSKDIDALALPHAVNLM